MSGKIPMSGPAHSNRLHWCKWEEHAPRQIACGLSRIVGGGRYHSPGWPRDRKLPTRVHSQPARRVAGACRHAPPSHKGPRAGVAGTAGPSGGRRGRPAAHPLTRELELEPPQLEGLRLWVFGRPPRESIVWQGPYHARTPGPRPSPQVGEWKDAGVRASAASLGAGPRPGPGRGVVRTAAGGPRGVAAALCRGGVAQPRPFLCLTFPPHTTADPRLLCRVGPMGRACTRRCGGIVAKKGGAAASGWYV